MSKNLLSLFFAVVLAFTAFAGNSGQRTCATMDNLQQLKAEDPGLEARMQQIEAQTAAYIQAQKYNQNTTNAIITIPVVFHVVYNTSAQNISDAKIQAQIDQLNLDFARLNADRTNTPTAWQSIAANTNIQFCLAQRDPSGNLTNGIERRQTTVTSFSSNNNIKFTANGGLNAWPATQYLNVWTGNLSGGLLGYAQFPGGPAATDGIVLLFSSVGSVASPGTASPYNLGRTATHEVGHWLNLYHIWGDDGTGCSGSDQVGDTPNQAGSNSGCPTFPRTDACTSTSPGVMFMNYMDYTNDGCMNMFTTGQSTRMNALFASGGSRASLLSSQGCVPPSTSGCGTPGSLTATSVTSSGATLGWTAVSGATSYSVTYTAAGGTSVSASTTSTSLVLTGLSASTSYSWSVAANCSGTTGNAASSSFSTLSAGTTCGTPGGLTASSITASGATISWTAVSGATSYVAQYKTTAATTWTSVNTTSTSTTITGLAASTTYQYRVQAVCSGVSGTVSAASTFTTLASTTTCSDVYESNNSSSTSRLIPTNTDLVALISSSTDSDWFRFTTTTPNTNIRIALTNLPADYDIRFYNSSLTQLAISQNGSTTSETITRNTTAAGTYYIRVYGYNGAFNTTRCYSLRVNVSSTTFRTADEVVETAIKPELNDMVIYPNPAHESINAEFNAEMPEVISVRLFDMMGKTVLTNRQEVSEGVNKFSFDLSAMNKGIYFLELISTNGRTVKKFIRD